MGEARAGARAGACARHRENAHEKECAEPEEGKMGANRRRHQIKHGKSAARTFSFCRSIQRRSSRNSASDGSCSSCVQKTRHERKSYLRFQEKKTGRGAKSVAMGAGAGWAGAAREVSRAAELRRADRLRAPRGPKPAEGLAAQVAAAAAAATARASTPALSAEKQSGKQARQIITIVPFILRTQMGSGRKAGGALRTKSCKRPPRPPRPRRRRQAAAQACAPTSASSARRRGRTCVRARV